MAKTPFTAAWIQAGSGIFQWGQKAAYWKGAKGWWASRKGHEGIHGPFRTPGAAQRWAEAPFREAHQAKEAETKAKAKDLQVRKAAQKEAQAQATWNGLPPEARVVREGQVWALRNPRHASHEILVVEVKKIVAVVLARSGQDTPWKGLRREPRTLSHLPKLYRLVGSAKVPADAKG